MKEIKEMNAKILKITRAMHKYYPELSKYIEEMPEPKPTKNKATVTLNQLNEYYDSLSALLNKYKLEESVRVTSPDC